MLMTASFWAWTTRIFATGPVVERQEGVCVRCVGCCDWVLIVWMGGTQGAAGGARCTRREVPVARGGRCPLHASRVAFSSWREKQK